MVVVVIVTAWIVLGVIAGLVQARRGHWARGWVIGALLGPFAIPLAIEARKREAAIAPRVLAKGEQRGGGLQVVVGVDGSPSSLAAAEAAATLLGDRLAKLTIAAVLDFDTASPHADSVLHPEPWAEERGAREVLEAVAMQIGEQLGLTPEVVLLAGRPADALEAYVLDQGADLLVTGRRGRGMSKALMGSCASRLAGKSRIPVLMVPDVPAAARPDSSGSGVAGCATVGT